MPVQRPRPYSLLRLRAATAPTPMPSRPEPAEDSIRPLSASAVAAGVMAVGVLQFIGDIWDQLPEPARYEAVTAIRLGFIAFLLDLVLLVGAWLVRRSSSPQWLAAANALGVVIFAGSALVVASGVSRAFSAAATEPWPPPPGGALAFIGLSAALLLVLCGWRLAAFAAARLKGSRR